MLPPVSCDVIDAPVLSYTWVTPPTCAELREYDCPPETSAVPLVVVSSTPLFSVVTLSNPTNPESCVIAS